MAVTEEDVKTAFLTGLLIGLVTLIVRVAGREELEKAKG